MKTFLPFSHQHEEHSCVSGIERYNYYPEISFCYYEKSFVWHQRKISYHFFSGKLSEILGAETNEGTDYPRLRNQNLVREEVYFEQEIQWISSW